MNGMYYVRGNPRDYDTWEKMGNTGWNWDTALKYFKKSEDNTDKKYAKDTKYHATGGLLKVGQLGSTDPTKSIVKEALSELGHTEIEISNADKFLGYYDAQGTVFGGERFETLKGYLVTAKGRNNLHIIKNALVTKLNFGADGLVKGIAFEWGGTNLTATSTKEVVLSAGAIGTPQLLMLSGIGPRDELDSHKIPVHKDLPVGFNLQDHVIIPVLFGLDNSTNPTPLTLAYTADQMYEYTMRRTGYFSSLGGGNLLAFYSTVNDPKYPNIQLHSLDFEKQDSGLQTVLSMFNMNDEVVASYTNINQNSKIALFGVVLLQPVSRGRVKLASTNPFDAPKIYNNYLAEQADVNVLVEGIKRLVKVTQTKAFEIHDGHLVRPNLPDCDKLVYQSDSYWACYVRQLTVSIYHPAGTSKMGPLSEAATVVDPDLKVKGVKGLRVVDASIIPKIVSGNINAPTIMVAEVAADKIKNEWAKKV